MGAFVYRIKAIPYSDQEEGGEEEEAFALAPLCRLGVKESLNQTNCRRGQGEGRQRRAKTKNRFEIFHTHSRGLHTRPSKTPPPAAPRAQSLSVHWWSLIAGGESNPWHRMRDSCSPPLDGAA